MSFLADFEQLRLGTPRLYNINVNCENSDYCTHSDKNKNCYLVCQINFCEDCLYGGVVLESKDCVDCFYCEYSELCYECVDCDHCYNCRNSQDIKNCSDCAYCYDCIGCKNCLGCVGLRQKEFCIFNQQYSKEDYFKKIAALGKGEIRREFEILKLRTPRKYLHEIQTEGCAGDYIVKSKNCFYCFDTHESQDCMYLQDCWNNRDNMDVMYSWYSELCYESFSIGLESYNCNFCNYVRTSSNLEYCELCFNCKDCFGCVGLKGRQYFILNKSYSREEYAKQVAEIKAQMLAGNEYGKHLPTTYKFEDTAAA